MKIVKLTDVERESIDSMPVEVATALLTEPKAKLSNRMRKNARAARERVFLSKSPIVNATSIDDPETPLMQYTGIEKKPGETKLAEKARKLTWTQLVSRKSRCKGRRMAVQGKYLKVDAIKPKNPVHEKTLARTKLVLAMLAQSLDAMADALVDEITRRKNAYPTRPPIDPVVRRRLALLSRVAAEQRGRL